MRTAGIKGETLCCPGTAEPAGLQLGFKDNDLLAPFMEKACKRKTGEAAAKNRCCHAIIMGTL